MVWDPVSATQTVSVASEKMPRGELKRAAAPVPSAVPGAPAVPATVVVTPSGVMRRIVWFSVCGHGRHEVLFNRQAKINSASTHVSHQHVATTQCSNTRRHVEAGRESCCICAAYQSVHASDGGDCRGGDVHPPEVIVVPVGDPQRVGHAVVGQASRRVEQRLLTDSVLKPGPAQPA